MAEPAQKTAEQSRQKSSDNIQNMQRNIEDAGRTAQEKASEAIRASAEHGERIAESAADEGSRMAHKFGRTMESLAHEFSDGTTSGYAVSAAYLRNVSTLGLEWTRFMTNRMQHNMEVARSLAECGNPLVDAWAIMLRAAKTTASDYSQQMSAMTDVCIQSSDEFESRLPSKTGDRSEQGAGFGRDQKQQYAAN